MNLVTHFTLVLVYPFNDKNEIRFPEQKITIGKPRATFVWKKESWASDTCMLNRRAVGYTLEQTEQDAVCLAV